MSDKVTTALLPPGATELDGNRGLPDQSRSEKLMALLWTVCALGTGSLLLAPWLTLIAKRDLLDNAGIFLALVILAIAYRHYRKKAPNCSCGVESVWGGFSLSGQCPGLFRDLLSFHPNSLGFWIVHGRCLYLGTFRLSKVALLATGAFVRADNFSVR